MNKMGREVLKTTPQYDAEDAGRSISRICRDSSRARIAERELKDSIWLLADLPLKSELTEQTTLIPQHIVRPLHVPIV